MSLYQIWVLDLNEWDVWFTGAPFRANSNGYAKPIKEWALQENAELCWNLAFFNMGTTKNIQNKVAYRTLEYVKANGREIGYGGTQEKLELNADNICSGWKTAIINGAVNTDLDNKSKRTRNMNGITTDGRYIHVQTTSKETELSVANYVNNYINEKYNTKVKLLLVQDAGGSTGCYSTVSKILSAGEKEGYNGRAVVTAVCAKRKNTPKVDRVLKNGCKGEDVKLLQQILTGVAIDGSYGPAVNKQVKVAQTNLKIKADGSCGPETQKKLGLR